MPAFFSREQATAGFTPLWRPCLCFVCLAAALLGVGPVRAGDDEPFGLEAVLELDPDDPGLIIFSPENILHVCSTALEKKDSYPTEVVTKLFLLRTAADLQLKMYENAKEDAKEVLKLSPDSVPAARAHAAGLFGLGAVNEAHEAIALLAKKNPRSAAVHKDLGVILAAEGKIDDAIAAFSKAIELDAKCCAGLPEPSACTATEERLCGLRSRTSTGSSCCSRVRTQTSRRRLI